MLILPAIAHAEDFPDLMRAYESGGRNVPNSHYDSHHTSAGVCQMNNENWRWLARTVDIDIQKFPIPGMASEHQQWQVCWALYHLHGLRDWTCCNAKLRAAVLRHDDMPEAPKPQEPPARHDVTPPVVDPFLSPGPTTGDALLTTKEAP